MKYLGSVINAATIYRLVHIATDRGYVGSTIYWPLRRDQHLQVLRKGKHTSPYLQNAWNKYGEDAFEWEVIETCEVSQQYIREQHYIDTLNSVFNYKKVAIGITMTDEIKAKIAIATIGNTRGAGKRSAEACARMSVAQKATPMSDKKKANMLRSLEIARAVNPANKPGRVPTQRIGVKDSKETIEQRRRSCLAYAERQRKSGIKLRWITNDKTEQKIIEGEPIPQGWRYGRQPKIGEIGRSRVGETGTLQAKLNMRAAHLNVKLSEAHCQAQRQGHAAAKATREKPIHAN